MPCMKADCLHHSYGKVLHEIVECLYGNLGKMSGRGLRLDKKTWLTIGVPFHLKDVELQWQPRALLETGVCLLPLSCTSFNIHHLRKVLSHSSIGCPS